MECILCLNDSVPFELDTFECQTCRVVFKNPENHPKPEFELARYELHNNDPEDQRYVNFLKQLTTPLENFLKKTDSAIDFGCGPGPALSQMMQERGYDFVHYDPYFFADAHLLIPEFYNVLTSTEVVEHFHFPYQSWKQMIDLVADNGYLAIMTQFLTPQVDYKSWWYKNDPTHLVFYREETMNYIAKAYDLEIVYNDKKSVIIFQKKEVL